MIDTIGDFWNQWPAIACIIVAVVAVIIINRIVHWVLAALERRVSETLRPWRNALMRALDAPLRALVWLTAASVVFNIVAVNHDWPLLHQLFPPLRDVLVICVAAWFLVRLVERVKQNLMSRATENGTELDPTAVDAVSKLCWIVIFISAVLVIMQALDFSIAGLLAFGGAAGIAVGFAAQSLVANFFGGLTIFASRIFKIGEYIIIPGTGLMGGVEHIGWRSTRIVGFDQKPFYVPNSVFNTSSVINHSRMYHRCIEQYVHLRYQDVDKVDAIIKEAHEHIAANTDIDQEFWVFNFDSYGDFALKLLFYGYTVTTSYSEYMRVKERLLLDIAGIIRKHGGELAIPVSNVHVPDGLKLDPPRNPAPAAGIGSPKP